MQHDIQSVARDPERLATLARTALLDSAPEESFDRLTRLASRLLGAPIALVSLVTEDRQFFKSSIGLAEPWATRREVPLSHSFCRHAVESAEPLVLADAREHPLFRDNPAIADLGVVAYAGIPLVTPEGHALGSFCVLDRQPRHWTAEQVEVLADLAASVMTEIRLRESLRSMLSDAAEERNAVEELRRREAQLAEAQTLANLGSWELDVATGELTWSDETYRQMGLEPQSYTPNLDYFFTLVHPEDRDRVLHAVEQTLQGGEPYCIETRFTLADGSLRYAQLRGEAVLGPDGQLVRMRGTGQDITERKLVEEARRRAEEDSRTVASRMRAVAEAAAGVIGAGSVDALVPILREACKEVISFDCFYLCRYEEAAHALAFAVGYDSGDLVPPTCIAAAGSPSERVIVSRRPLLTHRSSDPSAEGAVPIGSGRRSESIVRVPVLSGERVLGVLSVQSYTPDLYTEQDVEVLEAIASLTATALVNIELLEELRASEESYRTIFDASHDAIYIHDVETGALLDVNRRCWEMHGYSREELLSLGVVGVADGAPPYDEAHARLYIQKAAAGEPQRFEWLARRRDGERLWGDVYLQRVSILGQDRLLATTRDITERKRTEEARLEAERLAHEMAGRMRAVAGAAAGVIGATSVDALQEVLREECRRVIPFDAFALALYEPAEHTLAYLEGFDADVWIPAETISAAGTPAERVIRTRKSLITHHADDPEAAGAIPMGTGRRSESIIRTPILSGERVLGVLSVQSYTPELYREQDVEVLEAIASLTATALLNLELSAEREEAEEALREANEELEQRVAERTAEVRQRTAELEAVFQALPDLYFRLAADGTVLDYRAGDEDRLLPPEQFLGRSLTDMLQGMPVDVGVRLREGIEEVNRTGRLVCVEYPLSIDGVSCEFEARLLPLADGSLIAVVRDITDRVAAEQELKRREEHFRRLTENAHDMVAVTTLDGRIRYASPSAERILGYTPAEMLGMTAADLVHPDDLGAAERNLSEVVSRPGMLQTSLIRHRHKDGGWRVLEVLGRTLSPTSAEEGIVVNSRDVTDRVAAEEELRRREEHFRRLIENSHDLVVIVDDTNTVLYVSPSVERILGYTPEEWIGQPGSMITHPDDLEIGLAKLAEVTARPGTTVTAEFRVLHKDGSWRVMEVYSRTLDPASTADGIVVNARDITDRKEAEQELQKREEHFRRLIENAHDMVHVIDGAGDTLYVSPPVERILGYTPAELIGSSALMLVHPDDLARGEETLARVHTQPGATAIGEFRLRHKDGSYRTVESFGRLISAEEPGRGVVINTRDITDRVAAEEELRKREDRFRRLIENAHDVVYIVDAAGMVLYVSPSIERVLGYRPEEMLGEMGGINTHPDDLEVGLAKMAEVVEHPGVTVPGEFRVRHKDGSWRVIETYSRTLSLDSADEGIVVNARDITERKQFEEALQERETRFRRLTENSSDLVQIIYPDTRMGYTGPSVVHLLGYTPEEVAGLSNMEFIHPDDRAAVAETIEAIFASPGASRSVRYRVRHKDGRWRVFEAFGRTLLPDSADEGLVCNARDITERHEAEEALRRSEEHFRRLTENAHDLVAVSRTDGTLMYISPSVERILGYTPEEMLRMGTADLVHPDDVMLVATEYARLEVEAEYANRVQLRARHKDGGWRIVESLARRLSPHTTADGIVINARDVTERVEAERALQEREEHFRRLIENAYDMVLVMDAAGTITYASPSAQRVLGSAPDELVGLSGFALLHPDDIDLATERTAETLSTPGVVFASELRLRHRDGSYRILETFCRTLADDSAASGIVVNARDITERVEAERALQEREEWFRSLIENAHDMVCVTAASGEVVYASPAARRVLGYSPEEMVGMTTLDLVHPDDLDVSLKSFEQTVATPGTVTTSEGRLRHKDGSYRVVESIARTLSPDTAEHGLVCNIRDITERYEAEQALRRSEEHFRRLIENAHDLVMVVDCDSTLRYLSPSVKRILGYRPDELVGKRDVLDVHPDDLQPAWDNLAAVLAAPGTTVPGEIRLRHRDGTWRVLETYARTVAEDTAEQGVVLNVRDITERKEFEEALQQSEVRYRSLIENAHDIVTILDFEGRIIYQSSQVARVLGYDPGEMLGQNALDFVHPDDRHLPAEALQQIFASPGATHTSQYRFRHKDGSWRYLETFGRTLLPDAPEQGLVFNSRDVTERREAQQLLQEREEHFRKLIETSHDLVQTLDSQGNIVYTGPSVERLLGYTPEEITGKGASDFIHPDDHLRVAEKIVEALTHPGRIIHLEYRVLHKDGRWRWFEAMGRTLSSDTAEHGMVANARDITERREAEEELKRQQAYFEQLIASVDAGIAAWDAQGRFEYISPNAIPDPEVREWIIGKTHFEYGEHRKVRPEVIENRHRSLVEAIESKGIAEYEETIQRPDGSPLHLLRRNRPVLNEAGEVERVIGYSIDITERRRTEEAVRRATEEAETAREAAERANRAKSEFLSRMSHELRTPMNSILGFAQLLDRAQLPPEHKKGVGHILKAGRHLLQLINEVLEIARIEAGRHSLSLEPVRLGTALQEAVALVRPLAAQWRVELDDGPWPCCAVFVQADRQRLTQVLLNLLGNAIKYNRAGGRVRVTCDTVLQGERQYLAVRVHDTGRGVPADRADQLFTPFARLGAEQSDVEGTGLGLALSQRLTEAMGGALSLESSGPEGSVFRLELLVTADPLQRLEESEAATTSLDGAPHAPATLLYIEDNLANLSLVETILLSRPQWRTMPALQGQIGVELAREHTPELILLDLHLPDISGEEVLRRLRSDDRTAAIPVVVITADATRSTVERLRAAGADAYLTKPLDIDEFLETVERFLPSPE